MAYKLLVYLSYIYII